LGSGSAITLRGLATAPLGAIKRGAHRASRLAVALVAAAGIGAGLGTGASAETLREALASTYTDNPELDAQRAQQRATDEGVPQALSGMRPTVTGSADASRTHTTSSLIGPPPSKTTTNLTPRGFSISVTQPVFQGFRALNSVKQAEAVVLAGREALLNTEQNVLLDAVAAYVDVVRDLSIVSLQRNNQKVLNEQLRATQDRFSVGEVTRTDVAQGEARVSRAVSALNLAEANYNTSRANYARIVGHPPGALSQPPSIAKLLPRTLEEALAIADAQHPAIQNAKYNELAAVHGVDVTTGELLPTVSIDAGISKDYDPGPTTKRSESAAITGRLTVPLYQRGEVSSRVRESVQVRAQRRLELDLVRREVRAAVISAWGQFDAAEAQIRSDQAQVSANEVALAGVREEAKVGQRTVLDVLDAEQELLDSKVALVTTRRNFVVASYALLSAIGHLTAEHLGLPVVLYDPMEYYRRVRGKWFGLDTYFDR
jgi:outer membrane protein